MGGRVGEWVCGRVGGWVGERVNLFSDTKSVFFRFNDAIINRNFKQKTFPQLTATLRRIREKITGSFIVLLPYFIFRFKRQ